MDPVSQFKFACSNCGQHLQARPDEAGRTTECPSCFKKLIVPQAPTNGGGKLLITAALADSRRTAPASSAGGHQPARSNDVQASGLKVYLIFALVALITAVFGLAVLKKGVFGSGDPDSGATQLWTDQFDELQLLDKPITGRLNGWKFTPGHAIWKGTELIFRQDGGEPEALELSLTFPLKGGELVAGKSFELKTEGPPFSSPVQVLWNDEQGAAQFRAFHSGYLLVVEFDQVSKETVSGRIHLCLPDPTRSWVAGQFSASVETRQK